MSGDFYACVADKGVVAGTPRACQPVPSAVGRERQPDGAGAGANLCPAWDTATTGDSGSDGERLL